MRPVLEALRKRGRTIAKIWIAYGRAGSMIQSIQALSDKNNIPVTFKDRVSLDQKVGTSKHQGVVALLAAAPMLELETFLEQFPSEGPRVFVFLDGVQDPHNLGAIIRTADAAGLEGVVLPKHGVCPITPAVTKASAGATEWVPLVQTGNASQALRMIQQRGIFLLGADPDGLNEVFDEDLCRDLCLVIGGEGKGLRPGLKKQCDSLVSIPMAGSIGSLNVSVASGILFYEVLRQRREQSLGRGED